MWGEGQTRVEKGAVRNRCREAWRPDEEGATAGNREERSQKAGEGGCPGEVRMMEQVRSAAGRRMRAGQGRGQAGEWGGARWLGEGAQRGAGASRGFTSGLQTQPVAVAVAVAGAAAAATQREREWWRRRRRLRIPGGGRGAGGGRRR